MRTRPWYDEWKSDIGEVRFVLTVKLDLPPEIGEDEVRLLVALRLLEEHQVSLGKAAEIAGYSKPAFMEIASKRGVAIIDYPPGDLERELSL